MGEMADYAIEDEMFGDIFSETHTHYPKGYRKNRWQNPNYGKDPYKGIQNWIDSQWLVGVGKNTQNSTPAQRIIVRYTTEVLQELIPDKHPYAKMATRISKDKDTWLAFKKWVKETYK